MEHHNWMMDRGFPRKDPKLYEIFILGLICLREPFWVEVDGKLYYFQIVLDLFSQF